MFSEALPYIVFFFFFFYIFLVNIYYVHYTFFFDQAISGDRKITSHLIALTWMKLERLSNQESPGGTLISKRW